MSALSELPELLAEIAKVAGLPAALAIARVRGGTRVHFPAEADDDHWLPVVVGREAANKLCKHFTVNHTGGITLEVPLGPARTYYMLRLHALALRNEGLSVRRIARSVGVTMRTVSNWEAARKRAANSPNLAGQVQKDGF